jgi:hypothetical protein
MRPLLGERTFVVPLQHGIEAPDQVAVALGAERVLCSIFTSLEGPGRIRHMGVTPTIAYGELDSRKRAGRRAPKGFRADARRRRGPNFIVADIRSGPSVKVRELFTGDRQCRRCGHPAVGATLPAAMSSMRDCDCG